MKKYKYTINGVTYEVKINEIESDSADVEVNGTSYTVGLEPRPASKPKPKPVVQPRVSTSAPAAPSPAPKKAAGGQGAVVSPLPGVILRIMVQVGDEVKEGQTIMCLEAMKMENNIDAPRAGKITSIDVAQGASVMEGDVLVTIGD